MSVTTLSRARRAGSVVASLGVLIAMLLVASPAQAAPVVNLEVDDATITLGQSVTLTWNASNDTTSLTAEGDWSGSKALPNGSENVTPDAAGTFVYRLVADNDNEPSSQDTVTVVVAPGPITPDPVTFPDPCTVVIPNTPNVTYFVDYGDDDIEELEAGEFDGAQFSDPGTTVTFYVEANEGFTLADGVTTEWDYTAPESCFQIGPDLVTTVVACGSIKFTNTTEGSLEVLYVLLDEGDPEFGDNFTLAAGESRTVQTDAHDVGFAVFENQEDGEDPLQVRFLEVPQDCGDGGDDDGGGAGDGDDSDDSEHPTVAPAAGIARR